MRGLLLGILRVIAIGFWLWLIPCAWFLTEGRDEGLRIAVVLATALLPPIAFVLVRRSPGGRVVVEGVLVLAVIAWLSTPPSNEGSWSAEYARIPTATFDGDLVTLRNVRDFRWTSDTEFTPRYYDATFDLNELETLDFIKVHWGIEWIAHTMLSFGFRDGRHVTVSVETRRREGQEWSSVAGFFRQYTLAYVIGDELDLVHLRTNVRGEDVYLYPTNTDPRDIRSLFVDILESATALADEPEWYNTITDNCTTSLARHVRKLPGRRRWDPRLLVNGHTDEMGMETGWLTPRGNLEETRQYYYVNPKVEDLEDTTGYSAKIREGIEPARKAS